MSIASEITRIQGAKSALKASIIAKGVEVSDSDLLSTYASKVDAISGGGGSAAWIDLMRGRVGMTDAQFSEYELDGLDTHEVKDMSYLFNGCSSLTSIDLTGWSGAAVENINGMFNNCPNLTDIVGGKTQAEVDGGVKVLDGLKVSIDMSVCNFNAQSLCAAIRGLGTVASGGAMINLSSTQYATLQAYTAVDYIAMAKSKGWMVGCGGYSDTAAADEVAGTIIGKDENGAIKYVKYSDFVKDDFDTTSFDPISVLVIPKTHTVDGKCRGVSLMNMNVADPENGSSAAKATTMYWGASVDTALKNYSSLTTGNVESGGTLGVANTGYLPTDRLSSDGSVVDTVGGLSVSKYGGTSPYIPSPYGAEGVVNTQYRTGSSSNTIQANTDMDGAGNTQTIIDVVANSSASGILVSNSGAIANAQTNYPAFATCYRFQGGGYTDNSWYLPSCGEMGYYIVRWGAIDDALAAIIAKYGNTKAARVASGTYHWSSTEYLSGYARILVPSSGYVNYGGKNSNYVVRAFHAF